MWARKRIDLGWSDLAWGLLGCFGLRDRQALIRQVERTWSNTDDALACLSVRTGFDLLWKALELPKGSEVLISAVTIRDMATIIEHHGLVPVPIDIAFDTLAPDMDYLQSLITPKTRAIVIAHLFGSQVPMEPILALARKHGLYVIEDCAQAYSGKESRGHADSDVAMYSFGSIKTATALGGALFRVNDRELLARMRSQQDTYSVQSRGNFAQRLVKYTGLKLISTRLGYKLFMAWCRLVGRDHDQVINDAVRGFAGPSFFTRIRQQPSAPLARLLNRRLRNFDRRRLDDRARKGELLESLLRDVVPCAGASVDPHSHWVFPILADDPDRVIADLQRAGFDATQGQSMIAVPAPGERPETTPEMAQEFLAKIVYLPLYPEMPESAVRRMAEVFTEAGGKKPEVAGRKSGRKRRWLAATR